MMALGKRWLGFRRFKKLWRAFATRAKAHRLDQNWQSLPGNAQRSDHWAKNANLTCRDVNHCNYKVWLQKQNSQPEKHVESQFGCSPTQALVLSPTMEVCLGNSNEMCLQGLNLSFTRNQHFIMIWYDCSRPWMLRGSAPNKSENMNTQERLICPPFFVGGLVITHSIYANWRIHVIWQSSSL